MLVTKSYQESCIAQAFRQFSFKQNCFFLLIQKYSLTFRDIFFSRTHFAQEMGVCEKTIDRWCQDFIDLELMTKTRSLKNRFATCHYKLTKLGKKLKSYSESLYKATKYIFLSVSLLVAPAIPDVQLCLSSKVFNKEVSSLSSYSKLQTAPARDTQKVQISQTTARKEADVGSKEHEAMDLPEYVVSLTPLLQLTTHGQLKLSIFNQETIDCCWASVKQASGCKDVFKELANLCVKYCKDNEIRPDWPFYYDGLEAGFAKKEDKYTAKIITSAMIKPRVVVDSNGSASQALLMKIEREKMRQKQADWEAKRGASHVQNNLRMIAPDVEGLMQHVGASQQAVDAVKVHIMTEVQPITAKPESLSESQIKAIDNKADFVRKLNGKQNMNDFERILFNAFKLEIKETQEKFKIYDRWNVDEAPSWSATDKELVDWALSYINSMTFTREAYTPIEQEILLGHDSPRAKTGELQAGLILMRSLVEGTYQAPIEKVVTEIKDQIVCAQIANDDAVWENLKYSPVQEDGVFEEVLD